MGRFRIARVCQFGNHSQRKILNQLIFLEPAANLSLQPFVLVFQNVPRPFEFQVNPNPFQHNG